ncbi:MAG TPA: tyrosine--tRNA ligase [Candidatus Paceibacterota bacterium]|nr:tyrosine--tRNA ligase [Candidatus Paceibacterota bacterium]
MKLSSILRERGYVYQHSSESLEEITDGPKRTFYLGVDPTADSMHVGQLQGLLVLRRFVENGHKLIMLVGGGTGMIGDPGGKSAERNLLDDTAVAQNAKALQQQYKQLLGDVDFTMVNNADWLRKLKLMEFLRDIGKNFTVNEMVKRDSVRPRLETPDQSISYTEFSYMLLQAYDFLELHKRHDCTLQVGGSDQWGNMVSGVDLIRRTAGNTTYALSWPLLVDKTTGRKFGKSEGGATVWLDAKKTSPYQFYQFWLNADDGVVEEYLLKMTMLPKEEIEAIMREHSTDPAKRRAQIALATAVTTLVHGEEAARGAQSISEVLFADRRLDDVPKQTATMLKKEAPNATIKLGMPIVDALVESKLAASKREARQFIEDGAVNLSGTPVTDVNRVLEESDFSNGIALLKRGKRNVSVLILD